MSRPIQHAASSATPNANLPPIPCTEDLALQQILRTVTDNQRLLRALTADYQPVQRHRHDASRVGDRPVIRTPRDIWNLLGEEMSALAQEQLRVLILDTKHRLITWELVYQGTIDSIAVRVAELLRPAVSMNAPAVLLVHNHPSGDPTPSPVIWTTDGLSRTDAARHCIFRGETRTEHGITARVWSKALTETSGWPSAVGQRCVDATSQRSGASRQRQRFTHRLAQQTPERIIGLPVQPVDNNEWARGRANSRIERSDTEMRKDEMIGERRPRWTGVVPRRSDRKGKRMCVESPYLCRIMCGLIKQRVRVAHGQVQRVGCGDELIGSNA